MIADWIRRVTHRRKRPSAAERELVEEIRLHVELEAEDLEADGWEPVAARAEARRRLGGEARVREEVRRSRPFYWMDEIGRDVVYGWRVMCQRPPDVPGFPSLHGPPSIHAKRWRRATCRSQTRPA